MLLELYAIATLHLQKSSHRQEPSCILGRVAGLLRAQRPLKISRYLETGVVGQRHNRGRTKVDQSIESDLKVGGHEGLGQELWPSID